MRRLALLVLAAFLALPVTAGDCPCPKDKPKAVKAAKAPAKAQTPPPDDADYYKRTATKPPINGNWVVGFGANYVDKLGVNGAAGYHWKDHGLTLLGSLGAVQLEGSSGTTEFKKWCQTFQVPYSVGDRTEASVGVMLLFDLKKPK